MAFTIEIDNEAEHRMPHRTTRYGVKGDGPKAAWLTSMVMYWNCLRFVGDEGITPAELARRARTKTNLRGMLRWGFITMAPGPADNRAKVPKAEWIIRATPAGRDAREIWEPLFGIIEKRWRERFGAERIRKLREALLDLVSEFRILLPNCMPILGWGLGNAGTLVKIRSAEDASEGEKLEELPLVTLLAKALLGFALRYERESEVSLAIGANVLRVLEGGDVRVRDLPALTGVSKESIAMAFTFLRSIWCIEIVEDAKAKRTKVARLTKKGMMAAEEYRLRVATVERDWVGRFGEERIRGLREALESLDTEKLMAGLEPYPEGWRALAPRAKVLPEFPMVLHRGGYPDGS